MTYTAFFQNGRTLVFTLPQSYSHEKVCGYAKTLQDDTVLVLVLKGDAKSGVVMYAPSSPLSR